LCKWTYNVIYFTMGMKSGRDDHPARGEKREPARQAGRAGRGTERQRNSNGANIEDGVVGPAAKTQKREADKQAHSLRLPTQVEDPTLAGRACRGSTAGASG
jgi:hypothetical protein